MTSRQRIESALHHMAPDRTPVFEYLLLPPVAEQLLGRRFVEFGKDWNSYVQELGWENAIREYAANRLDMAERMGHDLMYVVPNPPPQSDSESPTQIDLLQVDDPVERLSQRIQQISAKPACLQEDCCLIYSYICEEMSRRGLDIPILAPAYAHGVWADVDLMQTMILAPEVAHAYFALRTRNSLTIVSQYNEFGIDMIGIGGDFAGNRPLISPEAYRTFIVPEVRKVSRRIHADHRWVVNASDGNLWSVIDDFLIGCEVDAYLEIDSRAGMELKPLKERFGDSITFIGNIDCGEIMSFGSTEEIRRHTFNCLEDGSGNGGHVFCCSNAITASVPLVNYIAMVEAYREFFALPSLKLA